MKTWPVLAVAFLFACGVSMAAAQDGDKEAPPGAEDQEDDELTPAQAMELLEDAKGMMDRAEGLLNDSSRGKALETEKELLKKLERELKDDPSALQQRILGKIGKLVDKAEKKEKDAADKLAEVIKKAKACSGGSCKACKERQQQQQQKANQVKKPGSPATKAYDPNRTDEPSKFRSTATRSGTWGNLPLQARAAMLAASKEEVPPEFQELWKKYFESLEKAGSR